MYIHVCVHKKPYLEDYHSNLEQIYDQLNIILFYNQVARLQYTCRVSYSRGKRGYIPL